MIARMLKGSLPRAAAITTSRQKLIEIKYPSNLIKYSVTS